MPQFAWHNEGLPVQYTLLALFATLLANYSSWRGKRKMNLKRKFCPLGPDSISKWLVEFVGGSKSLGQKSMVYLSRKEKELEKGSATYRRTKIFHLKEGKGERGGLVVRI